MTPQITNSANLFLLREVTAHHQGIGIVESQLRRHPDAELSQLVTHLAEVSGRGFENFLRNRAGIFRIGRDLVALERLPKNDGAAHALAVLDPDSGPGERLLRDFCEDVGFGKFFRANQDGLSSTGDYGQQQAATNKSCPTYMAHRTASALCALMKSLKISVAGRSRKSASDPF